jgi:predicted DNA-binding protein
MRTTTVTLPAEMHERLKVAAVKLNAPLTELVRRVLLDWLRSQGRGSR